MSALAALLALSTGAGLGAEVRHVDASLDLSGELLDRAFLDVDGDGRLELVLALRTPRGGRELRVHEIGGVRVEPAPRVTVRVLEDVLAYGFADVREEPGRELLLLTRSGVHSYSTTLEGYRDNARRLVASELIYDVPDRRALPRWSHVIPSPGGDRVLVPVPDGVELWGPVPPDTDGTDGGASYAREARFSTPASRSLPRDADRRRRDDSDGIEVEVDLDEARGPFFHDAFAPGSAAGGTFLRDARSVRAPALVDLDRDGRLDLLVWRPPELSVHLNAGGRIPEAPTRVETLPDYLTREDSDLDLTLVDLDGDGDLDLLAHLEAEVDGFENAEHTLAALLNDGKRLFPAEPSQLMRFEAGLLRAEVVDASGDGRPDLVVRQFELPSLVDAVTSIEFELTHLLYLGGGEGGRPFERRPALRQVQRFDEDSVGAAAANRALRMDCDGDGVPDLVEVDLEGYVAIRRLRLESGFLRGKSWQLDETPWKRFEVRGSIASLEVLDLNGDGLGDVVSESDETLAILLSHDPRGGRR